MTNEPKKKLGLGKFLACVAFAPFAIALMVKGQTSEPMSPPAKASTELIETQMEYAEYLRKRTDIYQELISVLGTPASCRAYMAASSSASAAALVPPCVRDIYQKVERFKTEQAKLRGLSIPHACAASNHWELDSILSGYQNNSLDVAHALENNDVPAMQAAVEKSHLLVARMKNLSDEKYLAACRKAMSYGA